MQNVRLLHGKTNLHKAIYCTNTTTSLYVYSYTKFVFPTNFIPLIATKTAPKEHVCHLLPDLLLQSMIDRWTDR